MNEMIYSDDVIETVKMFEENSEKHIDVIYTFAAELLGISTDTLIEKIAGK